MIQVVPKWRVSVLVGGYETVFWVYDMHVGDVLRKVATMQFIENGLIQPSKITVTDDV